MKKKKEKPEGKRDALRKATARLAPLGEQSYAADEPTKQQPEGVIRVGTGDLNLPNGIDLEEDDPNAPSPNLVFIVIIAIAIAFIAIIAWIIVRSG